MTAENFNFERTTFESTIGPTAPYTVIYEVIKGLSASNRF
jgi:hypothetical protein